ncbi:pentapeptide repeat-containing protein [Kineococcus radiotolerans]|uniref:pentapeptide repeat-containing protein n=1 Tax=Kineococcus radiotolerans TaxID=131568 RepID=UPI00003A408E|nr:pentapeptide repeat-containing protein [Kineococcus radiotolerans]
MTEESARARRDTPAPPRPDLSADEGGLEPAAVPPRAAATHDGLLFGGAAGGDLSGVDARDARFLGCVLSEVRADGLALAGARLVDVRLAAVAAAEAPWRAGTWQDVVVEDCRVGALDLSGARWARVAVRGGRFDFVDLRGAQLHDVTFSGCDLREVDLSGAALTRVRFEDCRVGHLDVTSARLDGADLTGAAFEALSGVGSLRGARVSEVQLLQLAPQLAGHLGLRVG